MKSKYFVSCATPEKTLGAIQIEAEDKEDLQKLTEEICPEPAIFRAYEVSKFDDEIPIGVFVPAEKLIELGYKKQKTTYSM